jgi:hypothetical protein
VLWNLFNIIRFFINLALLSFLEAMQTGFAFTHPTGEIRKVFLVFFLDLLKFFLVSPRSVLGPPLFSVLLTISVMQLPTLSIYFLLTTSKNTEPLNFLKASIYYSLTLALYKFFSLLTL